MREYLNKGDTQNARILNLKGNERDKYGDT